MSAAVNHIRTFRYVPYRFVREYEKLGWRFDPNEPLDHHHLYGVLLEHVGPGFPVEPMRDESLAEQCPLDLEGSSA